MPLIPKLLLEPGTFYGRDLDGNPVPCTFTPEDIQAYYRTGKGMLRAGLSVPVPKEHQNYSAQTPAQRMADRLEHNAGWVKDYRLTRDGRLYSILDIPDERFAAKLDKTVKWVSPEIQPEYVDGDGRVWKNAITHVALTLQPVMNAGRQEPFAPVGQKPAGYDGAMLMSLNPSPASSISLPVRLSLSLMLRRDGDGWTPRFPVRFAWVHDPTKRTQNRWKDSESGKVKYQKSKPRDAGGKSEAKPSKEAGKKSDVDADKFVADVADAMKNGKKKTAADEFGSADPNAEKRANEHAERVGKEEEYRAGTRTDDQGKTLPAEKVKAAGEQRRKKGLAEAKEHDFDLPEQVRPQGKGYSKDLHKIATPEIRGIVQKHDLGKYAKDLKLADKTVANARSVYSRWAKGGTQGALAKVKEAIAEDSKQIAKGKTHNAQGVPYAARMLAYRHMLDWADQDHGAKAVPPEVKEYQHKAKEPFDQRIKDIDRNKVEVNGETFRTGRERFVAHTVRGLIDTGAVPMSEKDRALYHAATSRDGTAKIKQRDKDGNLVLDAQGNPTSIDFKFPGVDGGNTRADERKKYVAALTQKLANQISSGDLPDDKLEKVLAGMSAEGQGTLKPDEFKRLAKETKRFSLLGMIGNALRFAWVRSPTPRTQNRWQNTDTGTYEYSKTQPSQAEGSHPYQRDFEAIGEAAKTGKNAHDVNPSFERLKHKAQKVSGAEKKAGFSKVTTDQHGRRYGWTKEEPGAVTEIHPSGSGQYHDSDAELAKQQKPASKPAQQPKPAPTQQTKSGNSVKVPAKSVQFNKGAAVKTALLHPDKKATMEQRANFHQQIRDYHERESVKARKAGNHQLAEGHHAAWSHHDALHELHRNPHRAFSAPGVKGGTEFERLFAPSIHKSIRIKRRDGKAAQLSLTRFSLSDLWKVLRFAWVHDPTKRTQNRWRDSETGKVKYQKSKPRDTKPAGSKAPAAKAPASQSQLRHVKSSAKAPKLPAKPTTKPTAAVRATKPTAAQESSKPSQEELFRRAMERYGAADKVMAANKPKPEPEMSKEDKDRVFRTAQLEGERTGKGTDHFLNKFEADRKADRLKKNKRFSLTASQEVEFAIGVLASASLGAPVRQKDVKESIRFLYKAGLINRTNIGAGEAWEQARESLKTKRFSLRFSNGDTNMADEYEGDLDLGEGEGEESPEIDGDDAAKFEECKEYLAEMGIVLPDDTTPENFVEHLRVACHALKGQGAEPEGDMGGEAEASESPTTEAPQTMLMSLANIRDPLQLALVRREEQRQRGEREKKIRFLEDNAIIDKAHAAELRDKSNAARFALTMAGEPVRSNVDEVIDGIMRSKVSKSSILTKRLSTATAIAPPVEPDGKRTNEVIEFLSGKPAGK